MRKDTEIGLLILPASLEDSAETALLVLFQYLEMPTVAGVDFSSMEQDKDYPYPVDDEFMSGKRF